MWRGPTTRRGWALLPLHTIGCPCLAIRSSTGVLRRLARFPLPDTRLQVHAARFPLPDSHRLNTAAGGVASFLRAQASTGQGSHDRWRCRNSAWLLPSITSCCPSHGMSPCFAALHPRAAGPIGNRSARRSDLHVAWGRLCLVPGSVAGAASSAAASSVAVQPQPGTGLAGHPVLRAVHQRSSIELRRARRPGSRSGSA